MSSPFWLLLPALLMASGSLAEGKDSPKAAIGNAEVKEVVAARFSAEDVWTSPSLTKKGAVAVYLTLHNAGSAPIEIKGVQSSVAGKAEMHQHSMSKDGVMSMAKMDSLSLPPHEDITFHPGGMHIMLFDLKHPLKVGGSFPLSFLYDDGAVMTTNVNVLSEREVKALKEDSASARSPDENGVMPEDDMPGMDMHDMESTEPTMLQGSGNEPVAH